MKVAVCLHGYFGTLSTSDFSTSKGGYEHIHKKIISKCDKVDFYVHCWQPEYENQIVEYYNPVSYKLEEQIDFKSVCIKNKYIKIILMNTFLVQRQCIKMQQQREF